MNNPSQSRRRFIKTLGMGLASAAFHGCSGPGERIGSGARKPNFVVFLIDDLGYGDIEPFGSKLNRTPNLTRMASEGKRLTSFYAAAPVCSPTRAALMTGCYPRRVGLESGSWFVVLMPGDELGIGADEITLPEILKSAGYATGCIGKWHLGDQPEFLPTRNGFDYYYGLPYSNDMWSDYDTRWSFPPLPLMRNDAVIGEVTTTADQARLTGDYTEETVRFIERNKDRPFFLYVPHSMVHWPHAASEPFMEQAGRDPYKAAVEEIDWSTGRIMQALRRLGLEENTLFIFTSDNGANNAGSNLPLRGGKGSLWEGGMRVPTIAWWPGQVPAGTACGEITSVMDFYPTFAGLAGAELPKDRIFDGKDMSGLLRGEPGARSGYEAFYYRTGAVRSGDWKYFADGRLYNLKHDISETEEAASRNPEIALRMERLLERAEEDFNNPANCRPAGRAEAPLRFLIPRPGKTGDEAHFPVSATTKK
jgi:arylsulfatase A